MAVVLKNPSGQDAACCILAMEFVSIALGRDGGLKKDETQPTGFAIRSPGAPHNEIASDQIRTSWVYADNI